jgi:hypothetical protein
VRYKETWQIVIKQQARKAAYSLFISMLEIPSFVLVLFSSFVFFKCGGARVAADTKMTARYMLDD